MFLYELRAADLPSEKGKTRKEEEIFLFLSFLFFFFVELFSEGKQR